MAVISFLRKIIRNQFVSPIQEFIRDSRAVGISLLACTILSLIISNSSWGNAYIHFFEQEYHPSNFLNLPSSLLDWINDGFMALFFFLVGMEIKRELLIGELATVKKASLPLAAALGGMIVPALIFVSFNHNTPHHSGWGIPMATDIAFSLGAASLLGSRVPVSLKIFLMALAIIDDLGAIFVIAVFYGGEINVVWLLAGSATLLLLYISNRTRFQPWWITLAGGLLLWYCIFNSGIHATIAGVLTALVVPLNNLAQYEHKLHDPISFIILPLFALANTAIVIPGDLPVALTSTLSWGVILGLVLGKPLGITFFSWATIQLKFAEKPSKSNWTQLIGMATLAGIGFTMSIFITMLAFKNQQPQNIAKLSILVAAILSILIGLILLNFAGNRGEKP